MAARPPRDDAEEPDTLAFGIAALDDRLDSVSLTFPADGSEIVRALDDPDVPYDPSGRSMALSAALDDVDRERFDSEAELLDALHPVFEERRQSGPAGLLERLRSLF